MYKITVEKTITETKIKGKEWAIIGKEDNKPVYGYTPEIEKQVETRQIIYIQTVDELDLVSVINAVNSVDGIGVQDAGEIAPVFAPDPRQLGK